MKKLHIGQRMYPYLNVSPGQACGQFAGKQVRIAARYQNICVILTVPAANAFLEAFYLLYFINQDIVMLFRDEPLLNPSVQIIFGLY